MFRDLGLGNLSLFNRKKQEDSKQKIHQKMNEKNKEQQLQYPKYFSVERQLNDQIKVCLHKSYSIKQDHKYYHDIETWVFLANEKKQINAGKGLKERLALEYYPSFQFLLAQCKMQEEICAICLCEFQIKERQQLEKQFSQQNPDDIYIIKCQHKFHLQCLKQLIKEKDWLKCPICNQIIGKMMGDQPDGDMKISVDPYSSLPGHEKGVITINYYFKGGVRNGVNFSGTSRNAYLPDNKEGNEVLQLLKQAFNRKLIFTVGRSVTTGLDNQTVWNGIHHKTSPFGGPSHFGYPDPTYLSRVKEQLASKGVTLQSIKK